MIYETACGIFLEDGTKFLMEVEEPETGTIERVSLDSGQLVLKAKQTLEDSLGQIQPVASAILRKLKTGLSTPADEIWAEADGGRRGGVCVGGGGGVL